MLGMPTFGSIVLFARTTYTWVMFGRKYISEEDPNRTRRAGRHGVDHDPIENDLSVAFVVCIAVALFMISAGGLPDLWSDMTREIGWYVHQVVQTAGS